jgi:hypothetical protein
MSQKILDSLAALQDLAEKYVAGVSDIRNSVAEQLDLIPDANKETEQAWLLRRFLSGLDALIEGPSESTIYFMIL